jgi:hypothetical protein
MLLSALPGQARRAGLLAAVTGTLLAACGSGTGTATGTPRQTAPATASPATASASPATPAQAASRLALAAYTGMWKEMQAAAVTADWQDPRLASYASGEALQILVTGLRSDHRQGLVVKGTLVMHPQVISRKPSGDPDQVVIRDCSDDSHWLNYVAATGRLQNNVPGGHRLVEALVTRASGQWTVSRLVVRADGTC